MYNSVFKKAIYYLSLSFWPKNIEINLLFRAVLIYESIWKKEQETKNQGFCCTYHKSWCTLADAADWPRNTAVPFLPSQRSGNFFMADHRSGGKRRGVIAALTSVTGLQRGESWSRGEEGVWQLIKRREKGLIQLLFKCLRRPHRE